jgi:O-antigen/teichoic acid export membrane protein
LTIHHGVEATGLYRIGVGIYNIVLFLPATVVIPLMPMISELQSKRMDYQRKISRLIRVFIFITLPLCIFGSLIAMYIIPIIYGPAFTDAYSITYFLLTASFLAGVTVLVETEFLGLGRTREILYIAILNVSYFIILSYLLIPPLGTVGYGVAFLIVEFNALTLYLAYSYQKSELNFDQLKAPLVISILFISMSFLIFFYVPEDYFLFVIVAFAVIILITEVLLINDDDKHLIADIINTFKKRFRRTGST